MRRTRARTWRGSVPLALATAGLLGTGGPSFAEEAPPYVSSISRIDAPTRALMVGSSWHRGCPVPIRKLRLVRLTYWGFDRTAHHGRLVIHRRWAHAIDDVFRRLYTHRFPIRRVRLVDRYGGSDRRSMRHDNTSAFNCRTVAGSDRWSQHAYGRAVDINPVENPFVDGDHVSPPEGRRFLDRTRVRRGMIVRGDVVWRAFRRIGWGWGGSWSTVKDYQHFYANGR